MPKTDIFITGVGGQGSLSASRFLGEAAVKAGCKVLVGEIHGMAQRGGIVESTVRIGDVHGPIIPDGQADVILGFEPVETLRSLAKASPQTLIITNTHPIVPPMVSMRGDQYPDTEDVLARIRAYCSRVIALDATALAQQVGNVQTLNTILLGIVAGSGVLPFAPDHLRDVILASVPKRAVEVNEKAYTAGLELGAEQASPQPVN